MTTRIYRYEVPIAADATTFTASFLDSLPSAHMTRGPVKDRLDVWMEVDPDAPTVQRTFIVVGTGQPIPLENYVWVETVLGDFGLVWHLIEVL